MRSYKDIDDYISLQAPEVKENLEHIRAVIKRVAPDAVEAIVYGMPTFKLGGNLVHFAAFKTHFGFYPNPSGIEAFREELAGFETSKGAIRFPLDRPLPLGLVRKIVQFRVQANLEKKGKVKMLSKPIRRPRHAMPDYIKDALFKNKVMDEYFARPPYQRNDYIGWISRAAREETKQKRLKQMIEELKKRNVYMKMKWQGGW